MSARRIHCFRRTHNQRMIDARSRFITIAYKLESSRNKHLKKPCNRDTHTR